MVPADGEGGGGDHGAAPSPSQRPRHPAALDGGAGAPPQHDFESLYELVGDRAVGSGSFGEVWRCRARGASGGGGGPRDSVAKRMDKARSAEQGRSHEALLEEVRLHRQLRHPHIVELQAAFDEPRTVWVVMECCDGGDLFDLIELRSASMPGLPENEGAHIMRHLLKALTFMHKQRVAHRDVKAENLLLRERGLPLCRVAFKLCDFGLAACVPEGSTLTATVGSPSRAAPEIARKEPYGLKVDTWSAGVLLYMVLSFSAPFSDNSDGRVLERVKRGKFSLEDRPWPDVSDLGRAFVRELMTVDAAVRPSAQKALGSPWLSAELGAARREEPAVEPAPAAPEAQEVFGPESLVPDLGFLSLMESLMTSVDADGCAEETDISGVLQACQSAGW